jgi:hypothetical protein
MLDQPGLKNLERIDAFCDHLTGFADEKFIKKATDLLTLMYFILGHVF